MSIRENTIQLKNDVIKIAEQYLNSLSPILIQYYNNLNKNNIDDIDLIDIDELYSSFSDFMIEQMEDMLGEVYQSVVKFIKNTYGNTDYPISEIEFYHKDNLTIQDRLFKWFNPASNNFINDKITAIYYLLRILKSECRNTEEKTKHDKLWELCDYFIINNEDEDFCDTVPACQLNIDSYLDNWAVICKFADGAITEKGVIQIDYDLPAEAPMTHPM